MMSASRRASTIGWMGCLGSDNHLVELAAGLLSVSRDEMWVAPRRVLDIPAVTAKKT